MVQYNDILYLKMNKIDKQKLRVIIALKSSPWEHLFFTARLRTSVISPQLKIKEDIPYEETEIEGEILQKMDKKTVATHKKAPLRCHPQNWLYRLPVGYFWCN